MMPDLPAAMMAIATACMGDRRRGWADAMQAEFEVVSKDGRQMAFAAGCLMTAWRDMHRHADGRFTLASYMLSAGVFLPVGGMQLAHVADFIFPGSSATGEVLLAGASTNPVLSWAQTRSIPALTLLWASLGVGHLCFAWLLLDRDWSRIFKVGAGIVAAMVTLLLLMEIIFLDSSALIPHAAVLAIEFIVLAVAARWHAWLILGASSCART